MNDQHETRVNTRRDGPVLVLGLDGPSSRNSISPAVYQRIQAEVIEAGENPDIRAIVLTGMNGFFCSGGNIRNLRQSASKTMAEVTGNTNGLNTMIQAMRGCPTPIIAAVEGGAAGAGVSLALACDMIVAAEPAKFTVAYVKVGLAPDGGVTKLLTASLPRQLVTELCVLGRPISVSRLHQAGVINEIVSEGEAEQSAIALANQVASGPAHAISVIKAEIEAAPGNDLATHLELEARGINRARFGAEAREGLAAFLEKRVPDFTSIGKDPE